MRQTKTVERSWVRAPPGAVLGSGTLNNGTQVGIPDTILQLATGLALSCWSENRVTIN